MNPKLYEKTWEFHPANYFSKFKEDDWVFFGEMRQVYQVKNVNYLGTEDGEMIFEYSLWGYEMPIIEEQLEFPLTTPKEQIELFQDIESAFNR